MKKCDDLNEATWLLLQQDQVCEKQLLLLILLKILDSSEKT
jgi:hypothetical protein